MGRIVNLPPSVGGFTFKGIHSSEFGVRQTPGTRVLSPQKRRTLLSIPGRSTVIVEEDGGYEPRVESINCSYVAPPGTNLQRQVRLIAGWLDGVGELTFDYEPEMHYNAFISSPPPTTKHLEYATFDIEFTINHPFAYETAQNLPFELLHSGDSFVVSTDGTIKTPAILTIKNVGNHPITNLIITITHITK